MAKRKYQTTEHYASTPYIQIPQYLLLSPEFNSLSASSRCLYLIFLAKLKPMESEKKNRAIVLRYDELRKITGFSSRTISKCLKELITIGYVDVDFWGSYPHNVSIYQVNMNVLSKKYPKVNKSLPEYLMNEGI